MISCEFELRKEAFHLCKEQSFGIQAALWAALRNPEHRMKQWLQLVAIPNAASSSNQQQLQDMKKRISDLEKARSHSDRRNTQRQAVIAGSPLLALPAPSAHCSVFKRRERRQQRQGEEREMASLVRLFRSTQVVPRTSSTL